MNNFSNLIEELLSKINKGEKNKEEVVKELINIIGINISIDQIQIKENKLLLNVSPTIKTTVILKKKLLLETLNKFGIKSIN